ncbi:MAG: hypothetical protein LBS95_00175 [Mycoplasmataceae bacterium]|nr:hypothetical protein [Mycoplasmataceae bacterium]
MSSEKNIVSNKLLKSEILNYRKMISQNKNYSSIYLISTILLLVLSSISLILIFVDRELSVNIFSGKNTPKSPNDYLFISTTTITGILLIIFIPVSSVWYYRGHIRIQSHMPFLLEHRIIDICGLVIGCFDFITAILASSAPIILGRINDEYAWFADTKVIIYIITTSFIFLLWSVIIPSLQQRIVEKDNEYFYRYSLFQYEKINIYIKYLQKIYKKRVIQFNENLSNKKLKLGEANDIVNKPVGNNQKFSFDTRRVYKDHISKFGNEHDLIKYIMFVEIFTFIHKNELNKTQVKKEINNFLRVKKRVSILVFNKKFLNMVKKITK